MKFFVAKKAGIIKFFILMVSLVLGITAVGVTGSYSVYAGKTTRKLPIYCVDKTEKVVALSFDASWGADNTLGILDTLKRYEVKANYFVVGFWAEKYSEKLKTLSDSGYIEVGTHSNTHPHMNKLSKRQMQLELETSKTIIENITEKKVDLFRAPFGEYCDNLLDAASELGMYTIQWDVDSLDWKDLKADEMSARIISKVNPGSIVLMHNDGKYTLDALPLIIEGLKAKGYSFVTIGDLIMRDNYTIDHTGKQIRS